MQRCEHKVKAQFGVHMWRIKVYLVFQGWLFAPENMPANHNTRKPDPHAIARHKIANPKVILNIGGLKHEVFLRDAHPPKAI